MVSWLNGLNRKNETLGNGTPRVGRNTTRGLHRRLRRVALAEPEGRTLAIRALRTRGLI